jgi:hypothetical protein
LDKCKSHSTVGAWFCKEHSFSKLCLGNARLCLQATTISATNQVFLAFAAARKLLHRNEYFCGGDSLHIQQETFEGLAIFLTYLFPTNAMKPYNHTRIDGLKREIVTWENTTEPIEIPEIFKAVINIFFYKGCEIVDYTRILCTRAVEPRKILEAGESGSITTKWREGVVRYPFNESIQLTLAPWRDHTSFDLWMAVQIDPLDKKKDVASLCRRYQ